MNKSIHRAFHNQAVLTYAISHRDQSDGLNDPREAGLHPRATYKKNIESFGILSKIHRHV